MLIVQAQAMGMCFGVEDALKLAHALPRPEQVAILGEIVHNQQVQGRLLERGFASQPEDQRQQLPQHRSVLITAHGISDTYRQRLLQADKEIIDTTCPLVSRVHKSARHLVARGYRLVLVGKPGHVEVLGITEDFLDTRVFAAPDQVEAGLGPKLAILAQTTTPPELYARVAERVEQLHPHSEVRRVDTICRPTRDRQEAIVKLLDRVEALVVVGGANSNNTLRLLEQAQERNLPCWRVAQANELRRKWFQGLRVVGLTAGTSTPAEAIQSVHRRLLEFARPRRRKLAEAQSESFAFEFLPRSGLVQR